MSGAKLLQGKVVVVTGAATGIGRAIAEEMSKQGAKVAINYYPGRDKEIAEMKRDIPDLLAVPGDISKPETSEHLVAEVVKKFGELNVFVSNAGICKFEEFTNVSPELFRKTVAINLGGCYFATQAAAKQMIKQGKGGSIIGISSISALVGGSHQTHYTPTKAGILSLMQSEACALGQYNIRCNALLPGTIATQLNTEDLADPEKKHYMESRTPLGRIGVTSDMAGPAVFLASDLSSFVTGAQLLVDGGMYVNLQ
ncbi:L-rhamnose-1-dehydrogenase [Brettanomyces nanus]|uniref:L-rhamnose-1-dehydrogenase n=1 Tax=Eeniella nana TaxID=13502 RepID=A0A875S4E4_EENNA|nr:L-rhamnose-1-dehydrogenase [Brettanomyces nanus]QPG74639.1 L-rhamnose-1-dehydrogenase [Brettanomyces nanus]